MAHPRKAIRDAIKTKLISHTVAGTKVYTNRVRPVNPAEMPLILIYAVDEPIATWDKELPIERNLRISIACCQKVSDNLDDELDVMAAQVEELMSVDYEKNLGLGRAVNRVYLEGTTINEEIDGELKMGILTLTYRVNYFTRAITGEAI